MDLGYSCALLSAAEAVKGCSGGGTPRRRARPQHGTGYPLPHRPLRPGSWSVCGTVALYCEFGIPVKFSLSFSSDSSRFGHRQ